MTKRRNDRFPLSLPYGVSLLEWMTHSENRMPTAEEKRFLPFFPSVNQRRRPIAALFLLFWSYDDGRT